MYEVFLKFRDGQSDPPKEAGCYLVMVNEKPKVTLPETELDSLIVTPGGKYYSVAHWNGEEWDEIYLDNVIISVHEDETFQVVMWTDRECS